MNRLEKYAWILPLLLAFAAHISALDNGFAYDDVPLFDTTLRRFMFFGDVWHLGDLVPDKLVYYRPVFYISLMLTRLFSGYEPWGYHLTVVLLHALNSVLVYFLASHFFKNEKSATAGTLITALLFAVHPVHIEVVSWISATIETLLTVFFLLAVIFHVQSRDHPKNKIWLILAALSFFLALTSKEMAIAFLLLAPLYDAIFVKPKGRSLRSLAGPYVLYALTFLFIYLPLRFANVPYGPSKYIIFSLEEGFLQVIAAFGYYFQKVLWPISVNPYTTVLPTTPVFLAISVFFLIFVLFACFYTFKRERELFFHIAFYVLCLAPALLISLGQTSGLPIAERYLYLPSYGICFIFGWSVVHFEKIFEAKAREKSVLFIRNILVMVILSTGAISSYARAKIWKNDWLFWTQAAKMNSQNFIPWSNLAKLEMQQNNCPQAFVYFDRALSYVNKDSSNFSLAGLYLNKANCLYFTGKKDEAIDLLKKSIALSPLPEAYFNLGMLYLEDAKGPTDRNLPLAKTAFEETFKMDKNGLEYAYHLGVTLELMGDVKEAKRYYEYCVSSRQNNQWPALAQERLKNLP